MRLTLQWEERDVRLIRQKSWCLAFPGHSEIILPRDHRDFRKGNLRLYVTRQQERDLLSPLL
jgi:hypothetical protein